MANYAATKAYNAILAHGLAFELRQPSPGRPVVDVLACVAGPVTTPNLYPYNPKASDADSGIRFMLQSPQEVVEECLQHLLGQPGVYSVALSLLNRVSPVHIPVDKLSAEFQQQSMDATAAAAGSPPTEPVT